MYKIEIREDDENNKSTSHYSAFLEVRTDALQIMPSKPYKEAFFLETLNELNVFLQGMLRTIVFKKNLSYQNVVLDVTREINNGVVLSVVKDPASLLKIQYRVCFTKEDYDSKNLANWVTIATIREWSVLEDSVLGEV